MTNQRGGAPRGVDIMVLGLVVGAILAGIAGIVFFEAVGIAREESKGLHDRYHE